MRPLCKFRETPTSRSLLPRKTTQRLCEGPRCAHGSPIRKPGAWRRPQEAGPWRWATPQMQLSQLGTTSDVCESLGDEESRVIRVLPWPRRESPGRQPVSREAAFRLGFRFPVQSLHRNTLSGRTLLILLENSRLLLSVRKITAFDKRGTKRCLHSWERSS